MAIFRDTIMIKDRPYDRAVQVTVIAPDDMNVLNVLELAERAWRARNVDHSRQGDCEGAGIQAVKVATGVPRCHEDFQCGSKVPMKNKQYVTYVLQPHRIG